MTTEVVVEKSTKTNDKVKLPKKYKIILLNDDVTPVEFVISLLMSIFRHPQNVAREITLKIHNEGSGVAGIYTYEIAEQKLIESTSVSRASGYPLVIKLEAE